MVTLLALGAALLYACGAALQHSIAASSRERGAGFIIKLFRRPAWLGGNLINAFGWALQAAALGYGTLVFVQPMLLLSVVLSLPLTAYIRKDMPGVREWLGSIGLVAGVAAFLLGSRPHGVSNDISREAFLWSGLCVGGASIVCVVVGHRRAPATLYAVAAGLLFGFAAALTKATVQAGSAFLVSWPLYALCAVTALAFYWMQRAYQSGPLAASFPVIICLDPVVSVVLGLFVFGERVAIDAASLLLSVVGAGIAVLGVVALSGSRFVEVPLEEPGSIQRNA